MLASHLKGHMKVLIVMVKALSGELSCMWTSRVEYLASVFVNGA